MIRKNALAVVEPDEGGDDQEHRWTELAIEATRLGFDVSSQALRALRYGVTLGPDVVAWFKQS